MIMTKTSRRFWNDLDNEGSGISGMYINTK